VIRSHARKKKKKKLRIHEDMGNKEKRNVKERKDRMQVCVQDDARLEESER